MIVKVPSRSLALVAGFSAARKCPLGAAAGPGPRLALPAAAGARISPRRRTGTGRPWRASTTGGRSRRLPIWFGASRRGGSRRKRGCRRSPPLRGPCRMIALAASLSCFAGLLEETDRERAGLIEELKEIGRRQRELADLVARLATELNAIPPDASRRGRRQAHRPAAASRFHGAQFRRDPAHDPLCLRDPGRAGCAPRGVGAGTAGGSCRMSATISFGGLSPFTVSRPRTFFRTAPPRSASVASAPVRSAPVRSAPDRSAPVKLAPLRLAPVRLANRISARLRSAPEKFAPDKLEPDRSALINPIDWFFISAPIFAFGEIGAAQIEPAQPGNDVRSREIGASEDRRLGRRDVQTRGHDEAEEARIRQIGIREIRPHDPGEVELRAGKVRHRRGPLRPISHQKGSPLTGSPA